MIHTVDDDHSNNFDELLDYLCRERVARHEIAAANVRNEDQYKREMAMADHYARFYQAAIHYRDAAK